MAFMVAPVSPSVGFTPAGCDCDIDPSSSRDGFCNANCNVQWGCHLLSASRSAGSRREAKLDLACSLSDALLLGCTMASLLTHGPPCPPLNLHGELRLLPTTLQIRVCLGRVRRSSVKSLRA